MKNKHRSEKKPTKRINEYENMSKEEMESLAWSPETFPLDSSNGIGKYDWGSANDAPALRGGRFINAENAGLFMLDLSYGEFATSTAFGFRCVYRP